MDILGMIIGVKLSFVVDIRIIKNVSFKATKAFWCCHRHVLRLSLAPLVSFTNSFYIFKTNFQCTIHSFWIMGIGINQAYAEHKLMKTLTKYFHFLQSELNILYGVQKNQRLHPHFLELRRAPKYFLISTFPPLKPEIYSALPNTTLTYFHGLAFQMSLGFLTCCT